MVQVAAGVGTKASDFDGVEISKDDFTHGGVLGKGSFGLVTHVRHKSNGKYYAMKAMSKHSLIEMDQVSHIMNEKRVQTMCFHPLVTNLHGCFQDDRNLYMVMEFVKGAQAPCPVLAHLLLYPTGISLLALHTFCARAADNRAPWFLVAAAVCWLSCSVTTGGELYSVMGKVRHPKLVARAANQLPDPVMRLRRGGNGLRRAAWTRTERASTRRRSWRPWCTSRAAIPLTKPARWVHTLFGGPRPIVPTVSRCRR